MSSTKPVEELLNLKTEIVHNLLQNIDCVIVDCDGVLWYDNVMIPGVPDVINKFRALHREVYFLTNNGTQTRKALRERAHRMGYQVDEEQIIGCAYTAAQYLKKLDFQKKVYVIGSAAIGLELDAVGIKHFGIGPDVLDTKLGDYLEREFNQSNNGVSGADKLNEVGAVIVGWDDHFTFCKMLKACNYLTLNPECLFLATNSEPVHKTPTHIIPDTGSIVAAVESCSQRKAILVGKPSPAICGCYIDEKHMRTPERVLMIGDNCHFDVAFGKNCGFKTLLVGSGQHSLETTVQDLLKDSENNANFIPDYYLPKLSDLMQFL